MCDEMAEVVTVWVELGVWKGVKRLVGFEIGSTKMPAGSFASDTHRFECCGWRACDPPPHRSGVMTHDEFNAQCCWIGAGVLYNLRGRILMVWFGW